MRPLLLGIVLFAVYAATLPFAASPVSRHTEAEARQLVVIESLVADGDLDVSDEYAEESHRAFHPAPLQTAGRPLAGRRHEPVPPGFAALMAPLYALGGATAVALACAALAAAAFAVALPAARTLVPDPWATGGILLVALSPPALAHATAVEPAWAGALLLALAIRFTTEAREEARTAPVLGAALALAALPWLDLSLLAAGLPLGVLLLHWTLQQRRNLTALTAVEVVAASLIGFVAFSEAVYGGLTPLSAAAAGGGAIVVEAGDVISRAPRLAGLWLDRDIGMLRWTPVLALCFHGIWLLWRSRRDHIARALPERREAEVVGALAASVVAALLAFAAFGLADVRAGGFPGGWLLAGLPAGATLVAWSLRHRPRVGAVLGALTLATSAWLTVGLATGTIAGWSTAATTSFPWGPAEALFPSWQPASPWAYLVTGVLISGLVALSATQWRRRRNAVSALAGPQP